MSVEEDAAKEADKKGLTGDERERYIGGAIKIEAARQRRKRDEALQAFAAKQPEKLKDYAYKYGRYKAGYYDSAPQEPVLTVGEGGTKRVAKVRQEVSNLIQRFSRFQMYRTFAYKWCTQRSYFCVFCSAQWNKVARPSYHL